MLKITKANKLTIVFDLDETLAFVSNNTDESKNDHILTIRPPGGTTILVDSF